MFDKIIAFSIHNKLIIFIMVLALMLWGAFSLKHLPIDAVPDITDNQVQVITPSPNFSAQEVERFITFPLELEMSNIPRVEELRSISRFGLSVITIVFEEDVDIYWAREQINQKIQKVKEDIPSEYGQPEMGPITTGLGEIYQYIIYPADGYEDQYGPLELRSIQDWIIKRQIIGLPGVVEVNSSGGYLKQYEIAIDQNRLQSFNLTMEDIFTAVESNNANSGGSYIEKTNQTYFIRGEGMLESQEELENVLVKRVGGHPVLIKNVAEVVIGHAPRFGAVTMNGKGEVVAGQVMMLKGANSNEVTLLVKKRIEEIKASLPVGVLLEPYLDRSKLVESTTNTVLVNLGEGALIVIFILVLLLGNLRAGLIVASVIPLSMLFAVSMMNLFGVSANLMSLGALDFGLIVDGAVIIVEAILHQLGLKNKTQQLTPAQQEQEVFNAASKIRTSAAFGEVIILIVYLPILFLQGVEGKMFIPMAQTVSFAILGALILSLTYVPMMAALFLKNAKPNENGLAERIINFLYKLYAPIRDFALRLKYLMLTGTLLIFAACIFLFSQMGGEFIPTLEEGDFALHQILPTGSSLRKGVEVSAKLQDILMNNFPEVEKVVTKIGTAEIPTDIMPIEAGDIFVIMKPKSEWTSATTKEEMFEKMEAELTKYPGVIYEFTQPIQMRFNELMTGTRQDIAIKIYGEDLGVLVERANEAEAILENIEGVGDIQVEPTAGLQQMVVDYKRPALNKYGVTVKELNNILQTAFAGKVAGKFYEGEQRYDIVVRLKKSGRKDIGSLQDLTVPLPSGAQVPMSELATIDFEEGPSQISRDDSKRRITIGVNARNIDIATLIASIKKRFSDQLGLPPGYYVRYGGQFENFERAKARLLIVVPLALGLIFLLLFLTFRSTAYALLIFTAIPLSAIGGVLALYFRGMPFSISAGVGFIALFGVAVLNGIVLVAYFNQLKKEGMTDIKKIIEQGTKVRLRPVIMTAAVASLGFLPMALSNSAGAEVQRPLATVVIGGLISATFLTLIIIPILYQLMDEFKTRKSKQIITSITILLLAVSSLSAQDTLALRDVFVLLENKENPLYESAKLQNKALDAQAEQPLVPNPWSISYSGEEVGLNGATGVQSINLGKTFRLPKVDKAYRQYYEVQKNATRIPARMASLQVKQTVTAEYINAAYYRSLRAIEMERQQQFEKWLAVAKRKAELGEGSGLEVEQIDLQLQQNRILIYKLEQFQKRHLLQLYGWTGLESYQVEALEEVRIARETDQGLNPLLEQYKQQQNILNAKTEITKTNNTPRPFASLSLQSVDGDILFFGYQAGINLPFAKSYQKKQLEATRFQIEATQRQYDWQLQQIALDGQQLRMTSSALQNNLIQQEQLMTTAESLLEKAQKSWQFGESRYTDLMLAFNQYYELQKQILETRKEYLLNENKSIHYTGQ
ncbi:MAG: CusA/CzcA family heavy metal efflux RND transporter [Saprospiraceae bacterium]